MSRIYLSFLFSLYYFLAFSQATKEDYINFALQQKSKGDYIAALTYFEKALQIDSESVTVLWDYAESLRLYKDYRKAAKIYAKVFEKEDTKLFIRSLFYLGEMQKMNGNYDEALETFKLAKRKYAFDKKAYLYQKSKQEIESCLWARKNVTDSLKGQINKLPSSINTVNSEFAHSFYDNQLFFSSLRADSSNQKDEIYSLEYKNAIYKSNAPSFEKTQKQTDISPSNFHVGNGSFSLDKKRFYYSICKQKEENLQCKIMVAYYVNGHMRSIDTLGEIINELDANSTMPFIANFDNNEVLFFASDRVGSKGGLDIFYSYIKNGTLYSKPIPVEIINSPDNELSPFYDSIEKKLYFSSSWFDGFGAYDIFYSTFDGLRFSKPKNAEIPINSSANDLYFFKHQDTSYFSSNRIGVSYTNNPTCCSDIFYFVNPPIIHDTLISENKTANQLENITESFAELNKRLPVTLYFHNDVPNPKSTDTITHINYMDSYQEYIAMIPKYKKEFSKGLQGEKQDNAEEDIESFFIEYVNQGVKDLEVFTPLLFDELAKGNSITLTVKGFASPLAKSDYNVNLTKRRISSLTNYLLNYEKGKFTPYLKGTDAKGTKLIIQEVPFGEYTAAKSISDNPNDSKNSIYARVAALERKIEIQSVSFLQRDSVNYLATTQQVIELGTINNRKIYELEYTISNTGKTPLEIERIDIPCACNTAKIDKMTLLPGEKTTVHVSFDPKGYTGNVVKSIYIHVKGSKEPLRLVLTGEIKEY